MEEGSVRAVEHRGRRTLATRNLSPGASVYGEELIQIDGVEYRSWDPYRSKLAAAIVKGLRSISIGPAMKVLYLGAASGTTVSHVSDLLGEKGIIYAVEVSPRSARELIHRVAGLRKNVVPILENARFPERYLGTIEPVDVVYCDIAQPDQTDVAMKNCRLCLKKNGTLMLVVKARSIDVLKDPKSVFAEEEERLRTSGFDVKEVLDLEPYEKGHAIIIAGMSRGY